MKLSGIIVWVHNLAQPLRLTPEKEKGANAMTMHIGKSMILAVAIGVLGSSFAAAGSIKTFHRSWIHSGGSTYSSRSYTVAQNDRCRYTGSTSVAQSPAKSKAESAKDNHSATTIDRTANKSTSTSQH